MGSAQAATDAPTWPPPEPVANRMRELQQAIIAPEATREQRDAAREELSRLLRSPAGQSRRTPQELKGPARAAIDPLPSVVKPVNIAPAVPAPMPPGGGVARVEVVVPPKPAVNPQTGSVAVPSVNNTAVDPRTGHVLHGTPGGYVDPRTGQFTPR